MNYQTAYYWQQKGNGASLVLQRFRKKRGGICAVFAAICKTRPVPEAGDFFQTRLLDWFRYEGLRLCGRGGLGDMDRMKNALEKVMADALYEIKEVCSPEEMDCVGMIGVGEKALLFACGEQRIYLLQRGFQGGKIKRWDICRKELRIQQADMQPGIGILLGTESFFAPYCEEMLAECMDIGKLDTKEKREKRLSELGMRSEQLGERDVCAVLFLGENGGKNGTERYREAGCMQDFVKKGISESTACWRGGIFQGISCMG